jgi:hypothetical protein
MSKLLHEQNPNKASHDDSKGTSQVQNQNVHAKVFANTKFSDF